MGRPRLEALEERKLLFSLSIDPDIFLAQSQGLNSTLLQASGFVDDFEVGTDPVTGLPILVATGTGDGLATVSGVFGYLEPTFRNPATGIVATDPDEIEEGFDELLPERDAMGNFTMPLPTLSPDPTNSVFVAESGIIVTSSGVGVSGTIVDQVDPADPMDPMALPEPSGDADLLVVFDGTAVTNGIAPYVSLSVAGAADGAGNPDLETLQRMFQLQFNATDIDLIDPEVSALIGMPVPLFQGFEDTVAIEVYRDGVRLDLFDFDNDGQPGYDSNNDGITDVFGQFPLNDPTMGMGGFDVEDAATNMPATPRSDPRNMNGDPLRAAPYRDELPGGPPNGDGESEPADFSGVTLNDVFDEVRFVFTGTLGAGGQQTAFHLDDLEALTPGGDFIEAIEGRVRAGIVTITGPIGATATFFDLYDRPLYSNQVGVDLDSDGFNDAYFIEGDISPFALTPNVNTLELDANDDGVPDGRVQTFEVPQDLNGDGDFNDIVGGVAEQTADFNMDGQISAAEIGNRVIFEAGNEGIGRVELTGFNSIDPLTGNELDPSLFSFALGGGRIEFVEITTPADVPDDGLRSFSTLTNSILNEEGVPFLVDASRFVLLEPDFRRGDDFEEGGFGFALTPDGDASDLPNLTGNAVLGAPFVRLLINPNDRTNPLGGVNYFTAPQATDAFAGILPVQGLRQGHIFEGFDFELVNTTGTGSAASASVFITGYNGPRQFAGSGIEISRANALVDAALTPGGDSVAALGTNGLLGRAQELQLTFGGANDYVELRRPTDTSPGLRGGLTAPSSGTPGAFLGTDLLRFDAITLDIAATSGSLAIELYEDTDGDGVVDPATDRLVRRFSNVTGGIAPQTFESDEAFELVRIVTETGAQATLVSSIALREAPASLGEAVLDATVFGDSVFTGALGQWSSVYQLGSVTVAGDLGRFTVAGDAGVIEADEDRVDNATTQFVDISLRVGRTLGSFTVAGRNAMNVTVDGILGDPSSAPPLNGLLYSEQERTLDPFVFDDSDRLFLDTYEAYLLGPQIVSFDTGFLDSFGEDQTQPSIFDLIGSFRSPLFSNGVIRNGTIGSAEFINTTSSSVLINGALGGGDGFFGGGNADGQDVFAFAYDGTGPIVVEDLLANVYLRVVDQTGRTLAAEQQNFNGTRIEGRLEFAPDEPGVYYLIVSEIGGELFDGGVPYQVAINGIAPVTFGSYREGIGSGTHANTFTPRIEVGGGSLGLFRSGTGFSAPMGEDSTTNSIAEDDINVAAVDGDEDAALRTSSLEIDIIGNLYQFTAGSDVLGATIDEGGDDDTARDLVTLTIEGDLGAFYTGVGGEYGIASDGTGNFGANGDVLGVIFDVGGRIGRLEINGAVGFERDTGSNVTDANTLFRVSTGLSESAVSGDVGVFRVWSVIERDELLLDTTATEGATIGLFEVNLLNEALEGSEGIEGDELLRLGVGSDLRFIDVPQIDLIEANARITLPRGVAIEIVDDAGGTVSITYNPAAADDGTIPAFASVIVVPIEDSAGVAIARIVADLSNGGQLLINGGAASGSAGVIGIGQILLTDASGNANIQISGQTEIDVYRITQGEGDGLDLISNTTPGGDIVAIDVNGLNRLQIQDGHLGLTQVPAFGPRLIGPFLGIMDTLQMDVGSALGIEGTSLRNQIDVGVFRPVTDSIFSVANAYLEDTGLPFDPFLNGLVVRTGALTSVLVGRSVGDVILQDAGAANIDLLAANNLNSLDPDREFSGIVGTIYSPGDLTEIRVGDGLVGRGDSPLLNAGIFTDGELTRVRAGGGGAGLINGANIDGVINAFSRPDAGAFTFDSGINEIRIDGGGGTFGAYIGGSEHDRWWTSPVVGIGGVIAANLGSFIVSDPNAVVFGTEFVVRDVLSVDIAGAFDASTFNVIGVFGGTTDANGASVATQVLRFGEIRNSTFEGELLSDSGRILEFIPTAFRVGDDVFRIEVAGNAGVDSVNGNVSDLFFEVDGSILDGVRANNIARTTFSVDGLINRIETTDSFLTSNVIAGELSQLVAGSNIRSSSLEISGPLTLLSAVGDIVGTQLSITGPSGRLDRVNAGGNIVNIDVLSEGPIQEISATVGDVGGTIRTTDPLDRVGLIRAGRDILLDTDFAGDVGTIVAGRNIGAPGVEDVIRVSGNLDFARSGGDTIGASDGLGQIYSDIRVDQAITGGIQIDGLPPSGAPQTFPLGTPEIISLGFNRLVTVSGDFRGLIRSESDGVRDIEISGSLLEGGRIIANDGGLGTNASTGVEIGGDLLGVVYAERSIFQISVGGNVGLATGGTTSIDGATIFAGDNLQSLTVAGSVFESFIYAGKTLINVDITGSVGLSQRGGVDTGAASGLGALLARIAGEDGVYVDDAATAANETADNVASVTDGDFTATAQAGLDGIFFTADDTVQLTIAAQDAGAAAANLTLTLAAGADGVLFTRDDVLSANWTDAQDVLASGLLPFDQAAGVPASADRFGSGTNGDYTFFRLTDGDMDPANDVVIVQVRAQTASGDIQVFTGRITDNGALATNGGLFNAGNTDLLEGYLNLGSASTIGAGDRITSVTVGGNAEDVLVIAGLDEVGRTPIEEILSSGLRPGGVNFGSFMTASAVTISAAFDPERDSISGGVISSLTISGIAQDVRVTAGVAAGFDGVYNTEDDQAVVGFGRVETVSFGSVSGDTSIYADRRGTSATIGGASGQTVFSGAAQNAVFNNAGIGFVSTTENVALAGDARFGGDLFNMNPLAGRGEQFVGDPLATPISGAAVAVPLGSAFALGTTGLTVTITGAAANNPRVFFDQTPGGGANPVLYLLNTQETQTVTITGPGATAGFIELDIISNDDASLAALITEGFTLGGDSRIIIDLLVQELNLAGLESSESVIVGGDIQTLTIGDFGSQDATTISTGVTTANIEARFVRVISITGTFGNLSQSLLTTDARLLIRGAESVTIDGDFRGEINVRRSIAVLGSVPGTSGRVEINGQARRSILRVGESLGQYVITAPADVENALSESRFSVGDNVGSVTVNNSVFDTSIQVGGDLGADGRPDEISGGSDDRATTGFIVNVTVGGTFVESDVVAGLLRGSDGFFGTPDDTLAGGLSTIGSVTINNSGSEILADVFGSDNDSESYTVSAAGVNPFSEASIRVGGNQAQDVNNFVIQPFEITAAALEVLDVDVVREEGDVYVALLRFNQGVDFDTVAGGLVITEVRANGVEVPLTLTTPTTAGQYRLEIDPADRSTVRVVFSRALTQRDLVTSSTEVRGARLSELPGAGLYRFDFADENSESPLTGRVDTSTIDADTARAHFAVVGDAGDLADTSPTDPNSLSAVSTPVDGDPIDLFEGVNLDAALATLDAGEEFRIRGIVGDHPDEQAGIFGNENDSDVYYLSLEAGQTLLIDTEILGAGGNVSRFFSATTTGLYQRVDSQLAGAGLLGSAAFEDFGQIPQQEFAQIQILESDTFVLSIGNRADVFGGGTQISSEQTIGVAGVPTGSANTVGRYDFGIRIFDDGDSGFSNGSILAEATGNPIAPAGNAGDGTRLITPESFLFDAVGGLGGLSGVYTDAQSAGSVFSNNDSVLPTFTDGAFTYTAMPGADGVLFTADDVIRVEIDAQSEAGYDVPIMLEIRDGGDGVLLDSGDDIVTFDPATTIGDTALLDVLRSLIIDPIDSTTPSLAGADRIIFDQVFTISNESADNITDTPVVRGDLALTLQEDALAISNSGDVIFVEVDALSREFANVLPDLDAFAEPSDPMNATDDFGSGFVLLSGDDFTFGTADDTLALPGGSSLDNLFTRIRTVISGGTTYLDDAATGAVDERADNLLPLFVNGSFAATPTAGADGVLFTADDIIDVALETTDPVTGLRSALLDTSGNAVTYSFGFGADATPFTDDDRVVDVAAFNALRFAPGTELNATIDGFDYTLRIDSADNADGILGARTAAGGNANETFDNILSQTLTGDLDAAIDTGEGVAFNNDDRIVLELTASDGSSQVSFGVAAFSAGSDGIIGTSDDGRDSGFTIDPLLLGAGADGELGFGFQTVLNQDLTNPAIPSDDPNPNGVAVGDFNNDGIQDIAVANRTTGTVSVLLGAGGRTFGAPTTFDLTTAGGVPLITTDLVAADLNGDGADDLVVIDNGPAQVATNPQLVVLLGDGIGGFALPVASPLMTMAMMPPTITGISAGDTDGDGDIDIAVTSSVRVVDPITGIVSYTDNNITTFTNNGMGLLASGMPILVGLVPQDPQIVDLDLDGVEDIVYTDATGVSVLLGTGGGAFAAPQTFSAGVSPFAVAVADLNADGINDLVVTNTQQNDPNATSGTVSVLIGTGMAGAPAFAAPVSYVVGNGPTDIVITNVDLVPSRGVATSPLDIVVANASGSISTLIGNGDGTFQEERRDPTGIGSRAIAVLDAEMAPGVGVTDALANAAIVTFSDTDDSAIVLTQSAGDDDGILTRLAGPDGVYADNPATTQDESADNRVSLAGAPEVTARGELSIASIRPGADLIVGTDDDEIVLRVTNVVDTGGTSRTFQLVVTAGADGRLLTVDDIASPDQTDGVSETVVANAYAALPAAGFAAFAGADGIYSDLLTTVTDDVLTGRDADNAVITSTIDTDTGKITTVIAGAIGEVNTPGTQDLLFTDVDVFHIGGRERITPGSTIRVTVGLEETGSDIGAGVAQAVSSVIRPAQLAIFDTTNSRTIDDGQLLLSPTDFSGRSFSQLDVVDSEFTPNSYGIDPTTGDFFVEFRVPDALADETQTPSAATYAIYLQGQINADYVLTVELTPALTAAIPAQDPTSLLQSQNVFLEFNGGRIDWLLSGGRVLEVEGFDATTLGFLGRNADDVALQDFIVSEVVGNVNTFFQTLANFSSVTGVPEGFSVNVSNDPSQFLGQGGFEFDDFSTVRITSSSSPFGYQQARSEDSIPLFGLSERSDPLNTDRNDEAVVFVGDNGGFVDVADDDSLDDFINSLSITIARQVGELLGLRTTVSDTATFSSFTDESNPVFANGTFDLDRLPSTTGTLDLNGDGFSDDTDGDGFAGFQSAVPLLPGVNPAQTATSKDILSVDGAIFAYDLNDVLSFQSFQDFLNITVFEPGELGDRELANPNTREYFFPRESVGISEFVLGRQNAEFLLDRIIRSV